MEKTITPTKEEIEWEFRGTNFGRTDHENLVKNGLLKIACGYHNGRTLTCILSNLDLVNDSGKLTDKGRKCLYEWFSTDLKE